MRKARPIILSLALAALAACTPSAGAATSQPEQAPTSAAPPAIRILALGDSLTAGFGLADSESYPAVLQARLRAGGYDAVVINGGISGETSSAALSRLDWMLQTDPDIVIVETGGNDGLRGVDLTQTAANLDEIVGRLTDEGIVVIVAGMQMIQNLGQDYATEFAAIYPAVAAAHDAVLIPFFLEGVAADPDLNQADFIHPNAAGYEVLVEHIYPFVVEAIGRLDR